MSYLVNLALSFDQFMNTVLAGKPDETLSSRAYRMYVKGRWFGTLCYHFINILFFWQDDHCYSSYVSELNRRHLPKEFQKV